MYQLALVALVAAESIWESSFRLNSLPVPRDYENFEYFAAHVKNPRDVGCQIVEPMPIPDHWLFSVPKGHHKRAIDELESKKITVFPQEESKIHKRAAIRGDAVPASNSGCGQRTLSKRGDEELEAVREEFNIMDPAFGNQWHIFNPEEPGHDMNIMGAWRLGATGKNVTVAIVDDGLDHSHPDFKDSFYLDGSYDYNQHRQLPTPELRDDWHGTRCAGEIAAAINDVCGIGIAPDAKVAGIRILSGRLTQNDEARALNHMIQHNDIFSCSWGPQDNGKTMEGPPNIVKRAVVNGVENGRAGLGSIYVQASGNGHSSGDNCNYDGYTNSIYSITVSSVTHDNMHPYYAESCSANLVSTYSSDRNLKITSSDPLQLHTDSDDDPCTNLHTGTSASAPMAAGIVALMLDRRPDLSWRDVQYVCREAAIPFEISDLSRGNWTTTHDGKHYHNDFGYGLLDAANTVKVADNWDNVNPQTWYFSPHTDENAKFTDKHVTTIEVTEEQLKESNFRRLEHVNVRLSYAVPVRGALKFTLTSPSGFEVVLADHRPYDRVSSPVRDWTFSSVAHWGENAIGTWTLTVENTEFDAASPVEGTFGNWGLRLWGEAEDADLAKKYSEIWDTDNTAITDLEKQVLEPGPESTANPLTHTHHHDEATDSPHKTVDEPTHPDDENEAATTTTTAAAAEKSGQVGYFTEKEHGLLFYLACSLIGVCLVLAAVVPITYWAMKRRQEQISYDNSNLGLLDDDIELEEAFIDHDSFEISDEEEPLRPQPISHSSPK